MNPDDTIDGRARRAYLRASVLRLGSLLGWQSGDVVTFTETVTDRSWRRCGCADFETVLAEYWAIGRVIQEKRARRHRDACRPRQEGDRDVAAR